MVTAVNLQFENQQVVLSFPQELLAMDYVQAFLERLKLESLLEKTPEKLSTADMPLFMQQFTQGYENYVEDRQQWQKDYSVDDILAEMDNFK